MYKNLKVLTKDDNLKVKEIKDFNYAKDLSQCVVTVDEFYKACKSFPIVFGKDKDNNNVAIAIMGIENNVFVQDDGKWKEGEYIPFYVRRYPFNFLKEKDKLILVYDEDSEAINKEEGVNLFEDGKESEYLKNILSLMEEYQRSFEKTKMFINKLEELDLLKDGRITIKKDDKNYVISPIKIVDENKLNSLEEDKILDLVKNGFYKLIVAHLISLDNVDKLAK